MNLTIEKSKWTLVKLGDVVSKQEENDRKNAHKRFDRFLKVEHMDAESLHIKRWASQEAGEEINPTFFKIFRKGQILFPTRNPHLRRTVLASFDGVCGEKTLTLQPNEVMVAPDFLPFLFHSESFYAHTTSSIIGSTNPHCRWRDVANYEFLLPPKEKQAEIAELLWTMDEVIEKELAVNEKFSINLEVLINDLCFGRSHENLIDSKIGKIPSAWEVQRLKDISTSITKGTTPSSVGGKFISEGVNFIKVESITANGDFIVEKFEHISAEMNEKLKRSQLVANDILFSIAGALGRSALVSEDICPANTNQALALIRLKDKSKVEFIYYFLKTNFIKNLTDKIQVKAAQPNLSLKNIREFWVPIPTDSEIDSIVQEIKKIYGIQAKMFQKMESSKSLQKSLINQVF